MKNFLLVFLGAGIGGVLRYAIGSVVKWNGTSFPWATFIVNILGCFIIGLVIAFANKNNFFADNFKLMLATGLCGGFTTFSAISLESLQLIKQANIHTALVYIVCSLLFGIAACAIGFWIIKQ
jgi:fluoride exporter